MITLEKNGIFMEVATELQASLFLRNGYSIVTTEAEKPVRIEVVEQPEKPVKKKRTRKAKVEAEPAEE